MLNYSMTQALKTLDPTFLIMQLNLASLGGLVGMVTQTVALVQSTAQSGDDD